MTFYFILVLFFSIYLFLSTTFFVVLLFFKKRNYNLKGDNMLNRLLIKNFAIIEDIECNFYEGMNVLIGETGAGKSIIIDALGLLMGNRSSFEKIRNGKTKAFIEGEFYIDDIKLKDKINEEYDDLIDEDNILVV